MTTRAYAEIGITTNFSFLRGGSDPRAYVHQASELRVPAIGIGGPDIPGQAVAHQDSVIASCSWSCLRKASSA